MTKILVKPDCGNSPKKLFLKDYNTAFAKGDTAFIIDHVSENINWDLVGDKVIEGKSAFKEAIEQMMGATIVELRIDHIVTHGKEGTVNGEMTMKNGQKFGFCDVYQFAGAKWQKIRSITTYVIEIAEGKLSYDVSMSSLSLSKINLINV